MCSVPLITQRGAMGVLVVARRTPAGFTAGEVYTFDQTSPSVTSVDVPANGSYAA